jgi:hypothetical protein
MDVKKCSKCKIPKILSSFHKRSDGYLRSRCVECSKEDRIKYMSENVDKIKTAYRKDYERRKDKNKEYGKAYRESNKESEKERYKKWASENRNSINDRNIRYRNGKIKDPLYKLKENIRCLVRISIKNCGFSKNTKTYKILGCSYDEFKSYIESLFEYGMSWENYPNWHLDHRTPISWAKTEEDIIKLNHYTNFQPKWAFDNLSKGNKYSD